MSLFKRKKKLTETEQGEEEILAALPKTDPGFRSAGATIRHTINVLDDLIAEKKDAQKTARSITQRIRDMDLHWKMPKKA